MSDRRALDGRVAIITGAAGAIGAATVRLMQARGARILAADIDAAGLATLESDAVAPFIVDLADEASIAAMIAEAMARFGRIDILHNNAVDHSPSQSAADGDIETITPNAWDRAFTVNLRGTMLAARAAIPHMLAQGGGAIVNMASNRGLQGGLRGIAYSASKAAIIHLTQSIAASHGPRGIRANTVSPGLVMTPSVLTNVPAAFRTIVAEETLTPEIGVPEDIAEVVAFLASDAAAYINGANIVADGGTASHMPGLAAMRRLAEARKGEK